MASRNEIVDKLTLDVKRLENKIEHRNLYNIRNFIVRNLINSGIAIDYILPFIISVILVNHFDHFEQNPVYRVDEVTENIKIETIDTSNGLHLEYSSMDFDYDEELLEYSTGWIINNNGLYERTVTSYIVDKNIDLSDTEKIFSMSKEEIENILVVSNIETISKNILMPEDEIYDEDAIIIINNTISDDKFTRKETTREFILNSLHYIIAVTLLGITFHNIKKFFKLYSKIPTNDKLNEYKFLFKNINKEELDKMNKILELENQNLSMLDEETNNNEYMEYQHVLRKI